MQLANNLYSKDFYVEDDFPIDDKENPVKSEVLE